MALFLRLGLVLSDYLTASLYVHFGVGHYIRQYAEKKEIVRLALSFCTIFAALSGTLILTSK